MTAGITPQEAEQHLDALTEIVSRAAAATLAKPFSSVERHIKNDLSPVTAADVASEAVIVDGKPVLRVSGMPEHIGRRIATFLKKEARADLERLSRLHAGSIKAPIRSISMKDTRSRWGSCSSEGNLSFSWRIVMAPPSVIDYLAAHEVAHLKELNHGPRFWKLTAELTRDADTARAWLQKHGPALHRFG